MNKTLAKIIILRKNNKLSQKEVADKLDIDVIDFLRYENGSIELDEDFLNKLSILYNINLECLKDDDYIIEEQTKSLVMEKVHIEPRPKDDTYSYKSGTETTEIKLITKKYNVNTIILCVLLTIIVVLTFSNNNNQKEITFESMNLTRDESIFMYENSYGILHFDNDELKFEGIDYNNQVNNIDRNIDVASIEINDNITAVLDTDGFLRLYGASKQYYTVDFETQYKDISLGDSHILLLDADNKVKCIKSSNLVEPCAFTEEFNTNLIRDIFAIEDFSIIIDEDLNIYTSGIDLGIKKATKAIKQIVGNRDNLWFVYTDNTVECILGYKFKDANQFTEIKKLVLLNDAIIGLKKDKTVVFSANNNKYDYINEWNNIDDIISYNGNLIAYSDNKFVTLDDGVEEHVKVEGKPDNIVVNINHDNINISFNSCVNCVFYEVEILENNYTISTNSNSILVPSNIFNNDSVYTISVKGIGKYEDSKISTIQFTYYNLEQTLPVNTPTPSIIPSVIPTITPDPTIIPTTPSVTVQPTVEPTLTPDSQ